MPPTRRTAAASAPDEPQAPAPAPARSGVDDVPVFGHVDSWGGTYPLDLEMFDDRVGEIVVDRLTAFEQPGSGAVLAFMRANMARREDPGAASSAAAALIYRALVDSDGLSAAYEPPRDAGGRLLTDHEDYDSRVEDEDEWSSRRRFSSYVESESIRLAPDLLEELGKYISERGAGRPTGSPSRSPRGRSKTRTGSARKR